MPKLTEEDIEGIVDSLQKQGFIVQNMGVPGVPGRTHMVYALMHHWTASTRGNLPSLGVVINGGRFRGPLYHWLIGRGGTIVFITNGYANHGGEGNLVKLDLARDGMMTDDTPVNDSKVDDTSEANRSTMAVSLELTQGEEIGPAQWEAWVALTAMLLFKLGLSSRHHLMHSHYTRRKVDLTQAQWAGFFQDVEQALSIMRNIPVGPHGLQTPQYEPPIHVSERIVASLDAPGGGAWVLTQDGEIHAWGSAQYYGHIGNDPREDPEHPNHVVYEVLGKPVGLVASPLGPGYRIITDLGYAYDFGPWSAR